MQDDDLDQLSQGESDMSGNWNGRVVISSSEILQFVHMNKGTLVEEPIKIDFAEILMINLAHRVLKNSEAGKILSSYNSF